MKVIDWVKIITEVLTLVAGGLNRAQAIYQVARKFHVSEKEINKRM